MKKSTKPETSLIMPITPEFVERRIYIIRGVKVMVDKDLAELYQVLTKQLNQQVKRNIERFPKDFMFQLTKEEAKSLRFQFGTLNEGQSPRSQFVTLESGKNIKYLPYAFTELGVAMLSSVLKSDRAVQMNIYIMRAFVKLREVMATHADLAEKMKTLEKGQKENSEHIIAVASTLKRLMNEGGSQKDAIGYIVHTD